VTHDDVPSDRDAFDAWARPRLVAALRYARRHGVDPEDIVQETLIRAREKWPVVASPAVVYGWCRTVAGRLVVDELRRPHRTREQPHADPAVAERAPVLDGPEAAVVADLHIAAVVNALDARDRDVLAMRLRDLDPGDIARQLSISTNAARQALFRARRNFEKTWKMQSGILSIKVVQMRRRTAFVDPAWERVASSVVIGIVAFSMFTATASRSSAEDVPYRHPVQEPVQVPMRRMVTARTPLHGVAKPPARVALDTRLAVNIDVPEVRLGPSRNVGRADASLVVTVGGLTVQLGSDDQEPVSGAPFTVRVPVNETLGCGVVPDSKAPGCGSETEPGPDTTVPGL
jgi:RNA polymerase sigma factor (sigma-70 family)